MPFTPSIHAPPVGPVVLTKQEWRRLEKDHRARAEGHTKAARRRKDHGESHPVEDFLFQYYPYSFALLENWQPGLGVSLEWDGSDDPDAESAAPRFSPRYYKAKDGWIQADSALLSPKERERLDWVRGLLVSTRDRPPNFACHGLHEWAMVYKGMEVRHEKTTRLRLPQQTIDALVESRSICCSHHDAFRFFAPDARPMNRLQPDLESRTSLEQPGCVHANMDLYKWAAKGMPWIGSDLLLDCFELAIELRDLDMRASPYDLASWGRTPVKIETSEGRRIYEGEQRALAAKAAPLRERLIRALERTISPI